MFKILFIVIALGFSLVNSSKAFEEFTNEKPKAITINNILNIF